MVSLDQITHADLLRRCGERRADAELWAEFQRRFQKRVFLYLLRAARAAARANTDIHEHLNDLAQEVYLRLVKNDGRILRSFREDSEFAVRAFLARVASSVVQDHFRYQSAERRQADVIPIDEARAVPGHDPHQPARASGATDTLLSMIDVERSLAAGENIPQRARNLLIFKLHYYDGFTAAELAAFPGFGLTLSGIEAVLNRTRNRLRKENRPAAGR